MKVLVACEFSGVVREAFAKRGHDAWSCDLLPSEIPGKHFQCDIVEVLSNFIWNYNPVTGVGDAWDLMIAFPPCTYLSSSGARWWSQRRREQEGAIRFVQFLLGQDAIRRVALENPIGILSTRYRKPDQIIHPWMFGIGETKATCLWLRGVPPLMATLVHTGRYPRVHLEPPSNERWKNRSRTYLEIAEAMAEQWGNLTPNIENKGE